MKYLITLLCITISLTCGYGQFHFISFEEETKTCPSDNTQRTGIAGWNFFQTSNGQINGDKKLLCETFDADANLITLDSYLSNEPIFLKNESDLDLFLFTNQPYNFFSEVISIADQLCDCSQSCRIDSCYTIALIVEGQIENQTIMDTVSLDIFISDGIPERSFFTESCFLSNKMENQLIKEIYFKFIPIVDEAILELLISPINIIEVFNIDQFGISSAFFNRVVSNDLKLTSTYIVPPTYFLEEEGWCCEGMVRVLHNLDGLPSKNNKHIYEIVPEDSTQRSIINIVNNNFQKILFQRHTEIRGGIVSDQNDDNLRHRVNIINESGDLCLESFIEIIMRDQNEFRYQSGTITFGNDMSCIMFRDSSKLVIDEQARLDYGYEGHGLLAMFPGTEIVIKEGGTLDFRGHLILREGDYSDPISLRLGKKQSLKFDKKSKISGFSSDAQLTIIMEGGLLDLEQLEPKYRPLLNIIYPESIDWQETKYEIYPNPSTDLINVVSKNKNENREFEILNLSGRSLIDDLTTNHGLLQIDVSNLSNGIYLLRDDLGNIQKIVISH